MWLEVNRQIETKSEVKKGEPRPKIKRFRAKPPDPSDYIYKTKTVLLRTL